MPQDQNPAGATETPQAPALEPKVEPTAPVATEPQTTPATPAVEMVTVPKSKIDHMAVRNRQLRNALYSEKPEVAKDLEAKEVRRVKDVLEDLVLSNPKYAQVMSQNQHLRTIVKTNPLSLIPEDEVMYDDEDIREVLTGILDKEVSASPQPKVDKTSEVPADNTPPTPTPSTPPSSASPTEPTKPPEKKNTSLAEGHREPMKRVENSIAERYRNGGK